MLNQYYRTFIALPVRLDDPLLKAREELVERLGNERISWVDPSRYHITLRFLGDTPMDDIEEISRSLESGIPIPEKKAIAVNGLGSFGPRKGPGVVWMGFAEDSMFRELYAGVGTALEDLGNPGEEGPFRAHLTLGRIRGIVDRDHFNRVVAQLDDRFRGEIIFDRLVFYRSEMGRGGPVYTPLHTLEFR